MRFSSLLLVSLAFVLVSAEKAAKPHVLFIVVDDLGWDDVGFRSHQIKTPNIDKLAADGVVLTNYYVQCVCSPSRATFLTGRYPKSHGIVDWIPPENAYGLPLNETTIANKMKEAGYATHAVGKWHLGFYKWDYTPTFRGFDTYTGFYGGAEDYFTHVAQQAYDLRIDSKPRCGENCSKVFAAAHGRYSSVVFAEAAMNVIKVHDINTPFFMYLAFQGVHAPAQVPQRYVIPYENSIPDGKRRTFAGMLSAVDEAIGNVTSALAAKHMLDNTLIVFTTDNGGPTTTGDGVGARNWPLRGGKHSIWEGGTRGTAFITGGPLGRKGEYHGLMHGADWLPTLSEVAGYGLNGTLPLDGVSQWRALNTDLSLRPREWLVYGNSTGDCQWQATTDGMMMVRKPRVDENGVVMEDDAPISCGFGIRNDVGANRWKLLKHYGGGPDTWCNSTSGRANCRNITVPTACSATGWCLYDVAADPDELQEVSARHPNVLATMTARMETILKDYKQYQIDKTCGPHEFGQDPQVGPYWRPWC